MTTSLGSVTFVASHEPPLPAGDYELEVRQTVKNKKPAGAADTFDETYVSTNTFAVLADRFGVDPTSIQALFPPPDNLGEYGNVLAHAVFTQRTLPWLRSPRLEARDSLPWLAILLFRGDEAPPVQVAHVGDVARAPFVHNPDGTGVATPSSLPDDAISYPDAFALLPPLKQTGAPPAFELEWGQRWSDPCSVIDLDLERFAGIAPRAADLGWLAHARIVSMAKKAGGSDPDVPGDFSVVVANRLPEDGTTCTAHLVSLEGMAPLLPGSGVATPAGAGGVAATRVRLVSLTHWTFTALPKGITFSRYLEHVNVKVAGLERRAPKAGGDTAVDAAFGLSYTAMSHATRVGDSTVSWYRGPLVSSPTAQVIVPAPRSPQQKVLERADEALRYDPTTGMLDVSYAVAWQLGRTLALASSGFSASLYEWKRAASRTVAEAVVAAHAAGPREAARRVTQLLVERLGGERAADGGGNTAPPSGARARMDRRRLFEDYAAAARDRDGLAAALADVQVPPDIMAWLTALGRLEGVPFAYLVPDAAMLPHESIRFFSIDVNWVNALLEGACSIGRSSTADLARDAVLSEHLYAAAPPTAPASGILLRSAVIDGWPGLEVTGYDAAGDEITTPPLRFERLAPSVLLYVTTGELSRVDVHEPAEGIHFGGDLAGSDKELRFVTVPASAPSGSVPGGVAAGLSANMAPRSHGATGVLDIDGFAAKASSVLSAHGANNNPPTPDGTALLFTSAELALQLVEGVQSVTFHRTLP